VKKKPSKISLLAAAGFFATSTLASAHHLEAPIDLLCPILGDVIQASWAPVPDATKYSVNIVATYDTGIAGPSEDTSIDWDFGTGDRTDGLPMSQSDLTIPLSALYYDFGTGPQPAVAAQLRVKGLHSGKNQQSQNNLFADFCIPAAAPAA
jgi:hypothetical protein